MRKPVLTFLPYLALLSLTMVCSQSVSARESSAPPERGKIATELAARAQQITDVVLANHLDPPARQQMILGGIKALYQAAGLSFPFGLSRSVSEVCSTEQLTALLDKHWPRSSVLEASDLKDAFLEGLLASVPGGAHLVSANDRKVAEQLEGNRYVGIHIALGLDESEKRPVLSQVFEGGPADRAGAKSGDILEDVDGFDTKGAKLRDVVDRIRGEEGTDVTIKVRQPKAKASRTLKITRGQLPRASVEGIAKRSSGDWEVRISASDPIGYLRITEIMASTPHELRKLARQLENDDVHAVVLDLRGLGGSSVHPAVLLADCLLEGGTIGRVRTAQGETTYQADRDVLFRGWPLAVLVNAGTSGAGEWLAAAIQDNRRGILVGTPTAGALRSSHRRALPIHLRTDITSRVAIGDGSMSIELATGRLERGDGRLLSPTFPTEAANSEEGTMLGSADMPPRGSKPAEVKTGVRPDHEAKETAQMRLPRPGVRAERSQPSVSEDDAIRKACQLLRDAMKKA
jgi:carboxyl-terminal processing protease